MDKLSYHTVLTNTTGTGHTRSYITLISVAENPTRTSGWSTGKWIQCHSLFELRGLQQNLRLYQKEQALDNIRENEGQSTSSIWFKDLMIPSY